MSLAETRFALPQFFSFSLHFRPLPGGCGMGNLRPMHATTSHAIAMSARRPRCRPGEVDVESMPPLRVIGP